MEGLLTPRTTSPVAVARGPDAVGQRIRVAGKFLYCGEEKFWVRGVTYGTFRPNTSGEDYDPTAVERDFARMAEHGFNAVRTYTVPPRWLLDQAAAAGLRVMVGLPWEQHIAFLDEPERQQDIVDRVRAGAAQCAGHSALLCFAIGNEIPAPVVRWYGRAHVERFLRRLYMGAKEEDPDALVTYVNYPTTEYLDLSFTDFLSFNVYLETEERLAAYLARLHNIAGDRPLVMAEIGLDSMRNGVDRQAEVLDWQVRTAFASACSGAFVFAWTDDWWRGGHENEDWDFGLTTRDRTPKPALATVRQAFECTPFGPEGRWPRISVIVCSYNGAATIRQTLSELAALDYDDYEVIVIDDGSTDATAAIASSFDICVISTENRGLSNARNAGLEAATGEIVAYIDDDAYPDPHWLSYLAHRFMTSEDVGVGGPNLPPPGDGPIAECVANAPGGPVHVLRTDVEADHIPGCNMAFRKDGLRAIGGFDPRFRSAGDDVDICWRLIDQGGTIGFSPGAVVWHHRRNSIRHYWKQQKGYGKAEALLEAKWPNRYNAAGHLEWSGRLYGSGLTRALQFLPARIYQGTWGSAPFQALYRPAPTRAAWLLLMPEWYLGVAALAGVALLGAAWPPLAALALPILLVALLATVGQAVLSANKASFQIVNLSLVERLRLRALTTLLHLLQPLARLIGRIANGLTLWRRPLGWAMPGPKDATFWSEQWADQNDRLRRVEQALLEEGVAVRRGGDYDRWDLSVRGGLLGSTRILMLAEEHGGGRQLIRVRSRPIVPLPSALPIAGFAILAGAAASDGASLAAALLGAVALVFAVGVVLACGAAQAAIDKALAVCGTDWADA